MKKPVFLPLLLILFVFLFTSCKEKKEVLYVYNWSYYTPEEVVEAFEKEYNCRVIMDYFASNEEMFAKLMVTKASSGYDIVIPSGDYVSIMKTLGMAEKIDKSKIPNLKYITDFAKEKNTFDPDFEYSIPYYVGAMGVAVNKNKLSDYEHSWEIFSREDLKGRMVMMDDMREVIGAALIVLGHSVNTHNEEELKEAYNLIVNEWKPNLTKFDAEGFAKAFATGEYVVAQGYAESFYEEMPEARWDEIDFFIPEEGGSLYQDCMVIPKGAKHQDLAHKFINYLIEPENYAKFLDRFGFPASTYGEAEKYMETKPHYTVEMMKDGENKDDLGIYLDMYNKYWEKIRYVN